METETLGLYNYKGSFSFPLALKISPISQEPNCFFLFSIQWQHKLYLYSVVTTLSHWLRVFQQHSFQKQLLLTPAPLLSVPNNADPRKSDKKYACAAVFLNPFQRLNSPHRQHIFSRITCPFGPDCNIVCWAVSGSQLAVILDKNKLF